MKIVIGADAAGFELKEAVKQHLISIGITVNDLTPTNDVVYYETAQKAAKEIQSENAEYGILLCGTGMGMSIVANKHRGIFAACVESEYAAKKCRIINNANIICMGGFIIGNQLGIDITDAFLNTDFCQDTDEDLKKFLIEAYKNISDFDKGALQNG